MHRKRPTRSFLNDLVGQGLIRRESFLKNNSVEVRIVAVLFSIRHQAVIQLKWEK